MPVRTAAVEPDMVLVVEMVHAMDGVVAGPVGVVFAAARIPDVELRRREGKVAGRASLVARAARGCLAALSDALGDVGEGGRDQSSRED